MSTPIQAGSTDQRLRCVAVQDDYSTFKTDLVIADIQSLVVKRAGAADVTVTENALDTDPDDAHVDGNVYNAGGGEYLVSVPDAAVASGAPSVKIYGTWTDGADSGYLIGDEYPLVGYDWQSSERSLTTAATTAIGTAFLSTALTKGTAGTIERAFWQILKTQAVTDGTAVADAGNTVSQFQTNLTAPDGQYDHMILVFVSNGLEGEARPIDTYVQANGVITLQEPLTEIPVGNEEFVILPQHSHPISEIQAGLATPDDLAVTIAPLSSSITARVNGTTISYFVGEVIAQTVAITDSAGSAVDLSAKTLQVVIDSPQGSHSDVQVIASGSITVSGASNNQITFTNSAAVTATARTLRWALRDTANGDEVLAHGRVVVTEAAEED